MSVRRRFPVWVVRRFGSSSVGGFCGHQHSDSRKAYRCARTQSRLDSKRGKPSAWQVYRVTGKGSETPVGDPVEWKGGRMS